MKEIKTLSLQNILNFVTPNSDLLREFENSTINYFELIADEMIEDFLMDAPIDEDGNYLSFISRESGLFEFEVIKLHDGDFEFNVYTRTNCQIIYTRTYSNNLPF